jgi:hypothetical protein
MPHVMADEGYATLTPPPHKGIAMGRARAISATRIKLYEASRSALGRCCGQGPADRLVQGLSALGRAQPAEMAARYGAEKAVLDCGLKVYAPQ